MIPEVEVQRVPLDELASSELAQSGFWARYKARFGWEPLGFRLSAGPATGSLLVLQKRVLPGLSLAYAPYGPDLPQPPAGEREGLLVDVARRIRPHLRGSVAFVRFDLPWGRAGEPPPLVESGALRRAGVEIQPCHTVLLDLSAGEQRLLESMHHKTRYNIGLAARRGVEVFRADPERFLANWYELKLENDRRDNIVTHSFAYFRALFQQAAEDRSRLGGADRTRTPDMRLLLARVEGVVLGGVIISLTDSEARYLHGASSSSRRNSMFTYALQWEAVVQAREAGCRVYDLYGIPPSDDPAHPMHGLYRFKTGFGGARFHRLGCHDVLLRPAAYRAMRVPEAVRQLYFKRVRRAARRALGSPDR